MKREFVMYQIGAAMIVVGFVGLFIAIWMEGWMILKVALTSLLLMLWGYSMMGSVRQSVLSAVNEAKKK